MKRLFAKLFLVGLLATSLLSGAGARAQPTTVPYLVDQWRVEDGLPQNSVLDIVQTADRYLWIATQDGLAHFDGVSFTVYNKSNTPAFRSNRTAALYETPDGALWIGTGRGLVRYRDGRFEACEALAACREAEALAGRSIRFLGGGPSGTLWIVAGDELVRRRDGRFQRLPPGGRIWDLHVDGRGRAWILHPRAVTLVEQNRIRQFTPLDGLSDVTLVAVEENAAGQVRIGTTAGRVMQFQNGRFETVQQLDAGPGAVKAFLFEDRHGQTWTATENVRGQTWTATSNIRAHQNGQPVFRHTRQQARPNIVRTFFEDRAGNVWVGTAGDGLLRLRRGLFTVYDASDGLSYDVTLSLTQTPDSAMWVGTNCRSLNRLKGGRFTPYADPNVPRGACVYSVLADSGDALWVGHRDLTRIEDGESRRYALPGASARDPYRYDVVKALYEDPAQRGVLWVGTINGLYRFDDGTLTRRYMPEDGLLASHVQYILRAQESGALWVSTRQGLSRLQDGQFTHFTPENSAFPSPTPRGLYEDPSGALWIGTYGDGLVRYKDGQFTAITREDGLFDNVASAIVPDGRGNLWMSGNRGIFRAPLAELNAFADEDTARVPSVGYGKAAGLKNPETNGGFQPAAWTDHRGRLWFPTLQGVAVVDPAEVNTQPDPPTPHVEDVRHQDELLPLQGAAGRLPQGRRSFAFHYTGIDLGAPEAVQFRYRLEPFDGDWRRAGGRQTAFYTNVPPGDYTFRVQATGAAGPWSEAATLRLRVPPYFYETTWFMLLCGLLVVGLLGGGYAGRIWALRRREKQLQQRVDEQTEALAREKEVTERQAERLRELDEAKDRFFANITHEFRTPLTLLLGPLRRLKRGGYGSLPAAAAEPVDLMIRNSRRLMRLINQILELTRLEAGTMVLDTGPADLTAFVERVTRRFAPLAERKRLSLTTDTPDAACPVIFDPDRMEHILGNLLANAVKFTPEGGRVRVRLTTEENGMGQDQAENGCAVLSVSDTGTGLSPEAQEHVFDRFFQADDTARRPQEGAGIGLSLVNELVELHGGTIGVESALGAGSTFIVRLPLPDSATEAETTGLTTGDDALHHAGNARAAPTESGFPPPQRPTANNQQPTTKNQQPDRTTLLVVDDNADVRTYVRSLFVEDYRVIVAEDGAAGLRLARARLPDLILADVMMPGTDGLAMTRRLKEDPATDCIPVLMLTARAGAAHAVEGLDTGAEDYVAKPFDADVLKAKVRATLAARRRLRDRLASEFTHDTAAGEAPPEASAQSAFEEEVRAAIRVHLADPDFTVEELASEVALSRAYFSSKLKEDAGVTPSQLIRQMRVERAAQLLREDAGNISEVAYAVGFNSLSYFSRRFKEHHGTPPSRLLEE